MKNSIKEATDRFVEIAFEEDSNIKDLDDFKNALFSAFDSSRGKNATGQFNDDEVRHFFESDECKEKIRGNVSGEEFDRIYEEVERGGVEVQRKFPKGVPSKSKDVLVVYAPKKSHTKRYKRSGIVIHGYNRGYRRWSPAEAKFLSIRKKRKLAPQQIVSEYNQHFKAEGRSSSSIKTKTFRI